MGSESKLSIQNTICAKFDLETLKIARETLYKTVLPDKKYVYQGPKNTSSEGEKAVHALDGILTKLYELDQNASSIIFACPSYQLESIISTNTNSAGEEIQRYRLNKMEADISDLKSMKSQIDDIKATMIEMITSKGQPSVPISDKSEFPSLQRERSSSVVSNKRPRNSESDSEHFTDTEGFQLPRSQIKKNTRTEKKAKLASNSNTLFSDKIKNGTPKPISRKKNFEWGKSSEESSTSFRGVIPDIFLTRCSVDTESQDIVDYLKNKGIQVKNIERKSRDEANFKSFRLAVNTSKDYDLVISGEPLPPRVRVRPWIYYRNNIATTNAGNFKSTQQPSASSSLNKQLAELESLEKSLSVDPMEMNGTVDNTNTHNY